jgi:hypothetical protein
MVIGPLRTATLSSAARPVVDFHEGVAPRKEGARYGYIDTKGRWVIRPRFQGVGSFSEGLAAAFVGDKWGYIDKRGEFVIPARFVPVMTCPIFIPGFRDGLVRIIAANENGYMDRTGRIVWRPPADAGETSARGHRDSQWPASS